MIENEETQAASESSAVEAQAAPAKSGTPTRHRRRRSGNRRRRPAPAVAGTAAGQPTAAPEPSGQEEYFQPEGEANPLETVETAEEDAAGGEPAAGQPAAAPGEGGAAKRRRRRRGGRRHRRRGGQPGAAIAGVPAAHPAASEAAAAENGQAELAADMAAAVPDAGELQQHEEACARLAAEEREEAVNVIKTYTPPKSVAECRLPAPAPDAAPAASETHIDLTKLGVRREADAYRVMKFPGLDAGRARRLLIQFLQDQREKTGLKKAALGLSGGLDSSVSAVLAAEALGAENVLLYFFSDGQNQAERDRASQVASRLRRSLDVRDIRPQLDAFFAGQSQVSPQRRRQRAVWEWMAVLYDQAALHSALVVTTGNKTKQLLGHGTDFGQNGYSVNLLGDLYQSQVRELARVLNLPGNILDPHASSLAKDELGLSVQEIDGFLYQIVDVRVSLARLLDLGVEEDKLRRIYRRIKESAFRRALSPVAESQAVYVSRGWGAKT